MRGEVESTEPYVIKLTNTYDNDEVMQSQLNIDPERRSLLFTTNYDLGKGQRRGGGEGREAQNRKTVLSFPRCS